MVKNRTMTEDETQCACSKKKMISIYKCGQKWKLEHVIKINVVLYMINIISYAGLRKLFYCMSEGNQYTK